jgi:hypothetical protein
MSIRMIRFTMFSCVAVCIVSTLLFVFMQANPPFSKTVFIFIISITSLIVHTLGDRLKKRNREAGAETKETINVE